MDKIRNTTGRREGKPPLEETPVLFLILFSPFFSFHSASLTYPPLFSLLPFYRVLLLTSNRIILNLHSLCPTRVPSVCCGIVAKSRRVKMHKRGESRPCEGLNKLDAVV